MMSALFIGATGLKTHGSGLQVVSHNLANVSTIGYKQQSILFDDLMYQQLPQGSTWNTSMSNQVGMGVREGTIRTLFTEGAFEPSNTVTDLALGGRGFFKVISEEGLEHYTRAGNFRFDANGVLRDPNQFALQGIPIQNDVEQGGLQPIKLDVTNQAIGQSAPRETTGLNAIFNLGFKADATKNSTNPYFGLLEAWDGSKNPPLDTSQYGYSQSLRFYDAEGKSREAVIYFDGAPDTANGQRVVEFVMGFNPELDGGPLGGTPGAGLVMSGTLTFSGSGELLGMSAFTPNGGNPKDLTTWTPAPLSGGVPQGTVNLTGLGPQNITLNLGISSTSNSWSQAPASAGDIGTDSTLLPNFGGLQRSSSVTTAYGVSSSTKSFTQDGWATGYMTNMEITQDGLVRCMYSNGQQQDLYRIPVFRFTSEDGLRREGLNHYSATDEAGAIEFGRAGDENYGKIISNNIETSNVDMSREMVNMIIMQRGFQMNSKTVTTADTMLQRALELKQR